MKISKNMVMQLKRIPTRFDDITREIYEARTMSYYNQFKSESSVKTFRLGEAYADKFQALKGLNFDHKSIDKII